MADPVLATVAHQAPMLIRWGRGNALGLFSVRHSTPVEIRGAAPEEMLPCPKVSPWHHESTRIHGGHLWTPFRLYRPERSSSEPAPLDMALELMARGREDRRLTLWVQAPFRSPYGSGLHTARSLEHGGRIPQSAEPHVEAAREEATRAMSAYAATHLVHDGLRLYTRLPVPLLDPSGSTRPRGDGHSLQYLPDLLPGRIGPGGALPWSVAGRDRGLADIARHLSAFLEGIEQGDEDIDAFLSYAPGTLIPALKAMKDPAADPIMERLWPMLVSGMRGERPAEGIEAAATTIRWAARHLAEGDHRSWGLSPNSPTLARTREVLGAYIGFVDHVIRPALVARVEPDDEMAMGALAP